MSICIYCGAPLDNDSQFCTNCGKKIDLCPKCGTVLKEGSLFCAKCGTRIDTQAEPVNSPQVIYTTPSQEVEVADNEWEKENKRKWYYLLGGIAIVVFLTLSWIGYNQFYKYTHIDVHELLENLKLPKEYYHSAKEIVNNPDFDQYFHQGFNGYAIRGWIVYNHKYGKEIKFNNRTFNSDTDEINDFYWIIGHILDCWNTSPAEAIYSTERDGSFEWVSNESTFYYTSPKSKGIQFMVDKYDQEGDITFKSVDGKYEANFKQVQLN